MFNPEDFTFSLGGPEPEALVNGFQLRGVNLNQLPALEGQGISMALVNLDACAINLPHVHPRATEVSQREEVMVDQMGSRGQRGNGLYCFSFWLHV